MSMAQIMQAMSEAGAPFEAILIAVRAIEERDAAIAEKRAVEAARTRLYRERGGGKIPETLRIEVFERDQYTCCDCGAQEHLQCDHVHPVSKGGETTLENLQTLCRPCNARKRDRIRKRVSTEFPRNENEKSEDADGQPPVLDKESVPQTPFKEIKPTPRTVRGSACGVYLPVGWKPSTFGVGTIAGEIVGRRGQDWAKRAFETFENHWRAATGKTARKGDWQATWANWVIEQDRRDGQNGTRQSNPQYGLRGSRPDPAVDMLRAANAELEAERAAGYQEDDLGAGLPLPAYLTS